MKHWWAIITIIATASTPFARGDNMNDTPQPAPVTETATFGGGCFWCVEAVFEQLPGVLGVTSGYQGGKSEQPTYEEVCRGDSGHAEVVRIEFDPARISYEKLLDIFFTAHDPTTPNRQGADVGTQYRSVIFHHTEAQREQAAAKIAALDAAGAFRRPIVTQLEPAGTFYSAEAYHQDYYRRNRQAPYSQHVIREKLLKLGMKP